MALSRHPSANQPWWRADGTPLVGVASRTGTNGWPEGGRSLEVFIKQRELPEEASIEFTFEPAGISVSRAGHPYRDGKPLTDHEALVALVPNDVRSLTLKSGIAAGSWHGLAKRGPSVGVSGTYQHAGQKWTVLFQEPVESGSEIHISASHNTVAGWETRIVAVDLGGNQHSALKSFESVDKMARTSGRFERLSLAQVKEFRFEVRPVSVG